MVKVISFSQNITDKDESFYKDYDLVCALTNDQKELEKVNEYCRSLNVLFLSGFVDGLFGHMFVDFKKYQFIA
jgi:ubiquitin-like 1-activating enzyme E1 A